ncbi:MAG: ATP-binding protein, partial [Janthinobacterium lividum]
ALQRSGRHTHWLRAAAAVVMGLAIAGMHYTGMAAANFPAGSVCLGARDGVSPNGLAILVIVVTGAVLTIAVLASVFDARLALSATGLASSQAIASERQALLDGERSARQLAERTNVLKDEFLATLSHELRTPLSAILGWSQILRGGVRNEETLMKGLDTIERNARAQARLIDDLMDMNKIVSGKISLDIQRVDPNSFIRSAVDTIRPAAFAKQIRLEQDLASGTAFMSGDTNRLQQVMWNLLSNAVKFTPRQGRIDIALTSSEHEIQIQVSDSGIGIDAEFLPYVFDRFRQADASTTRRYGGLGLGLAIVKQLVELHGGSIRAESGGANMGTRFLLGFPRTESAPGAQFGRDRETAVLQMDRGAFKSVDLSALTVLVVDDEADALDVVRHLLRQCGARTLVASNATEGLLLIRKELPDILVSDIGMPQVDGIEFIKRLRNVENQRCRTIPAIALSAFTRTEDQQRALDAGFSAYLTKPIEPAELVQAILDASLAKLAL